MSSLLVTLILQQSRFDGLAQVWFHTPIDYHTVDDMDDIELFSVPDQIRTSYLTLDSLDPHLAGASSANVQSGHVFSNLLADYAPNLFSEDCNAEELPNLRDRFENDAHASYPSHEPSHEHRPGQVLASSDWNWPCCDCPGCNHNRCGYCPGETKPHDAVN